MDKNKEKKEIYKQTVLKSVFRQVIQFDTRMVALAKDNDPRWYEMKRRKIELIKNLKEYIGKELNIEMSEIARIIRDYANMTDTDIKILITLQIENENNVLLVNGEKLPDMTDQNIERLLTHGLIYHEHRINAEYYGITSKGQAN